MSESIAVPAAAPVTKAPRHAGLFWLGLLLSCSALVLAGFAAWQTWLAAERTAESALQQQSQGDLLARLERELENAEQARAALERRLKDAEGVNQSLREELLGLGERARLLEDAVSRLAERNLSGAVLLRLNEAEFLLRMGAERLQLFDDPQATVDAFRLADAELAALDDPLFAGVRQTITAEIAVLEAAPRRDTATMLRQLESVADALPSLVPAMGLARVAPVPLPDNAGWLERIAAALSRFVRVRELPADSTAVGLLDVERGRAALAVDVQLAKAALARDDDALLRSATQRARQGLSDRFDPTDPAVAQAIEVLDSVLAAPAAGDWPPIGAALEQLRNLRATRALAGSVAGEAG